MNFGDGTGLGDRQNNGQTRTRKERSEVRESKGISRTKDKR